MRLERLFRCILCIIAIGYFQYVYLQKQHEVTKLRLEIPRLSANVKKAKEENLHLRFLVDQFENPQYLGKIARDKRFSHLKYPLLSEIITIRRDDKSMLESDIIKNSNCKENTPIIGNP